MKKVLIASAVFPPEQVTSALMNYDLAIELSKQYKVTVIRPYPTRPVGKKYENADLGDVPFQTILVSSFTHPESQLIGRFRESISFGKIVANYIKKHHEDIDFIYNGGWQLFGYYLIAKAAKKYGIPYMVPIQDIYPESLLTKSKYPSLVNRIIKSMLLPMDVYYQRNAACVRTISEEMRDYLSQSRKVPQSQFLVVNNWQNDEDFIALPQVGKQEKLVFAYVGSINVHANVDMMIRAFKEAAIPNSEFRIYGGGNQKEECQRLVERLKMENVSFDYVDRTQIAQVQAEADVLLLALPSGNGEFCLPSKLTSYMLSGKPVLASVDQGSATKRFIESAQCGKVVSPDRIDEFANALRDFTNYTQEERIMMGERSRMFALEHLTKKANLQKVVEKIGSFLS